MAWYPGKWLRPTSSVFQSGFEGKVIHPFPEKWLEPESWQDYEWYPERASAVAQVVSAPVRRGEASCMMKAVNLTTEPGGPSNEPFYWSAVVVPMKDPKVVSEAKASVSTLTLYFLLPPQSIIPTVLVWTDMEIFSLEKFLPGYDYGTDWMAEVGFSPFGVVGSMTSTAQYNIYPVYWATDQFKLKPDEWYFSELVVDFRKKSFISFRLEGPGVSKKWTPPLGKSRIVRKPSGYKFEAFGAFVGVGNEAGATVYLDDLEVTSRRSGLIL